MSIFSSIRSYLDSRTGKGLALTLAFISLVSLGVYITVSAIIYRIGFPLDDAWIHQTYARNLALHGEWAFIPGKVSGGSTSPLWSAILAGGFWFKLSPYIWTWLLGLVGLWGISFLAERTVRQMSVSYKSQFPWVGAALALEWHLVWSAASGMETLLFTFLSTTVIVLIVSGCRKYFGLGLLAGLSVWIRPDGITLLGPLAAAALFCFPTWRMRLQTLGKLALGFGSLFALYLVFNLAIAGSPWPNTFYAKQAEYAAYLNLPILQRIASEALQPLIGVGILLLPGLVLTILSACRTKNWVILAAAAWPVGFLLLYAWKLPVTYQHGRYVIPSMPALFILGLAGLSNFSKKGTIIKRFPIGKIWNLCAGMVLLIFWARGAYAYAQDVAVINSEMVSTAQWVSENLPAGSLVAAHDIGALGYFGGHDLVDLAGLISPDVVPFIRDEKGIATYLNARQVDYLVTFPDWYPQLVTGLTQVYTTGAVFAPAFGEANMAIYKWNSH